MKVQYFKKWSSHLGRDMEFKVYGESGKPTLVFPAQEGRFFEYEDFGMVKACEAFIEEGKIQLFTVDGIDKESWCNNNIHPSDRAKRHNQYDNYITEEMIPIIHYLTNNRYDKFLTTGCSMGGYHSANFFFKHPNIFDSLIALSGVYRLKLFIDDYMDENVYFNTPLAYLKNLNDHYILEQYRKSKIVIVVGQGAWEDDMIEDTINLKKILDSKQVYPWFDFWGKDVNHDWVWWRKMIVHFLNNIEF